ncbi:MAG: CapA family protein, partial [Euryarchaeota archaeon]
FSLANNHISDAWEAGVNDTIEALNQQKKAHFGYGQDLTDARKPALIEENGIRLGSLGYSCLSTNGENYATSVKPGVCPLATEYLEFDIPRLKNEVDHVIVVLHWGEEYVHYPTPDQIAVAHRAIDLGASAVVGMHPHVIQGIERYKGGLICYSLGNFIFSDIEYELLREGKSVRNVIIQLNANKESLGVEFAFEKNKIRLNSVTAFKLDRNFLPTEVPLSRLHTNLSKLNTKLEAYIKDNSNCLQKINGPQLGVHLSNGKYMNRYLLKPINGYQASVGLQVLKLKLALANRLRRVTRPFSVLRGN